MIQQLLKSSSFQEYLILLIVNVNALTTGLGVSWSLPTLVSLLDVAHTALSRVGRPFTTKETTVPLVASISFLGGFAYYILLLNTADRIGRKQSLLMAGVIRIISYSILLLAEQTWMVLLGRLFCGFSDAFTFYVSTAEVTRKAVRKQLGFMFEMCVTVAISTVLSVGPYMDYRCLNLTALSAAIASCILTYYLPERPCFYFLQGSHYPDIVKHSLSNSLWARQDRRCAVAAKLIYEAQQSKRIKIHLTTLQRNRGQSQPILRNYLGLSNILEVLASSLEQYQLIRLY